MKIETVPIGILIPWPGNPRKHGELDVAQIADSIKFYGWTSPILAQRGTNRIVAGHGRLEAAKVAGLKEIPVIYLDLTDQQATAYTVADNKLAELSRWDFPALKDILVGLDDGEFDLMKTGFNEDELKKLIDWEKNTFTVDENQPRLDEKSKIKCPECGHEFTT